MDQAQVLYCHNLISTMVISSPLSTIIIVNIVKYNPRFGHRHIFKDYELPLPVRNVKEHKVLIRQQPMHLPHESIAVHSKYPVEFNEKLLPSGLSAKRQYWQDCEPWLEQHPAREKIASGDWVISPLRLYGYDAQYFKDRSCAVLTMSSILCRLPSWDSRLLLTVVPLYDIVPDVTMPRIYDVLAWISRFSCAVIGQQQTHSGTRGQKRPGMPAWQAHFWCQSVIEYA